MATFIIFLYKKLNYLKTEISKLFTKTKKRHDIRNKRPMQNNFKTELLIFNRRNMINTHLISNKKKENQRKIALLLKILNQKVLEKKNQKIVERAILGKIRRKKMFNLLLI